MMEYPNLEYIMGGQRPTESANVNSRANVNALHAKHTYPMAACEMMASSVEDKWDSARRKVG